MRGVAISEAGTILCRSMKVLRAMALLAIATVCTVDPAAAQEDPSREFFAAYQEFQRAERLEREGRAADAAAKFRYVATQLSQVKSQHPDWQPLVVDFRLRKTQEAIVRLEGALDSPTLGPPPDLATMEGDDDILPPVRTPRHSAGSTPPSISISLSGDDDEPAGVEPLDDIPVPAVVEAVPEASAEMQAEVDRLRQQLDAEKSRSGDLEKRLQQGDAELSSVSMELEKTKVVVVDLNTQLRQIKEAGEVPAEVANAAEEEIQRLADAAKALEEAVAAAQAEKEELAGQLGASKGQIEELQARVDEAEAAAGELRVEVEAAKAYAGEMEAERDEIAATRAELLTRAETAEQEVQTLSVRVTELEEERVQLIAARDEAQVQAAEAKTALEKSAELIEANRQLEEKLTTAAAQIAGMESDAAAKEEVIAGLQSDLDNVRTELVTAQTKLKDDRKRFDDLQAVNDQLLKQYDEVTGALAAVQLGDVTAAEAKLLQEENEILRGIIMRQIKEQARREQAYRLAQEEIDRLEIRSDTLNDKINELAKPTLELTAAEQAMLRRPLVTVHESDGATIRAQVEVLKPAVDNVDAGQPAAAVETEETLAEVDTGVEAVTGTAGEVEEESSGEGAIAAASLSTEPSPEVMSVVNQAREEFVKGNFASAEKLYQRFVELQPESVVALANLGVAQFRQGKLTAAQLALEKAVNLDSNDAFSLTTLGAVMIEQNRIEDAVGYLERANDVSPDDPITLNYLGVASSQLGQFGKAEQSLRRAITVRPEYAEAHFNLAVIYATAKPPSIALAKRHYERSVELGAMPDKRLDEMLKANPGG